MFTKWFIYPAFVNKKTIFIVQPNIIIIYSIFTTNKQTIAKHNTNQKNVGYVWMGVKGWLKSHNFYDQSPINWCLLLSTRPDESIELQVLKTSRGSPRTSSIEATIGSEDSNESTDYNQAASIDPPTIGRTTDENIMLWKLMLIFQVFISLFIR